MKLQVSACRPTADLYDFKGHIHINDDEGNSNSFELKEN